MKKIIFVSLASLTLFLVGCNSTTPPNTENTTSETIQEETAPKTKAKDLPVRGLYTNTSKRNIELDHILSGGPGKDGIPAIDTPTFKPLGEESIDDEV